MWCAIHISEGFLHRHNLKHNTLCAVPLRGTRQPGKKEPQALPYLTSHSAVTYHHGAGQDKYQLTQVSNN